MIIRESAVAAMEYHGKIHRIKTACPLPPYLHKLYHKELRRGKIQLESIVKGELFDNPAHRGVLAAGSKYFRTLFKSTMQAGDSSTTEVKETTYEALRTVLKYIYTKSHRDVFTFDNVLDVYELSGKYLLHDLQKQCVWYMQSSSNLESTVLWYIACKDKAGCDKVKFMLEGKLVKNWRVLAERNPELVVQLDEENLLSSIFLGTAVGSIDK